MKNRSMFLNILNVCLGPISVKNKHGTYVPAPCGKCAMCLEKKRLDWTIRLTHHGRAYNYKYFCTFTYANEHLTYGADAPTLVKSDFQNFLKRFRHVLPKKSFSYFMVGEYGSDYRRPHYHALFFLQTEIPEIEALWGKGFVEVKPVTQGRIKYILKYHVLKDEFPDGCEPSYMCCSKGIGINYVHECRSWHKAEYKERNFIYYEGKRKNLPRYMQEKIFSKSQREINSAISRKKAFEKVIKEGGNEKLKNYFANKLTQIRAQNDNLKIKLKKTNQL